MMAAGDLRGLRFGGGRRPSRCEDHRRRWGGGSGFTGSATRGFSAPRRGGSRRAPLHRGEIAGDAAVVADELALIRLRVFEVRVVHEVACRFSARRREATLQRLAILATRKILEADVDVAPRRRALTGDRAEVGLRVDARRRRPAPRRRSELVSHESKRRRSRTRGAARDRACDRRARTRLEPAFRVESCIWASTPFAPRTSSRSQLCFCLIRDLPSIAHHWNGVCGFRDVRRDADRDLGGPACISLRTVCRPARALADLHDPRTSSSLRGETDEVELHAVPAAREDALGRRQRAAPSVTFLFTTSRMRWLPAPGANVTPLARTLRMSSSTAPRP